MKNYLPRDLFSFAAIASSGGFSAAAKKMGVSPSVLSKRLQRLEKEAGVNLLQRTTRELRLTPAGEKCYEEVVLLKNCFENILEKIRTDAKSLDGKLRISAPYSFGQLHLTPAVLSFMQLYPEIEIELLLGQPSVRLLEKNVDVGIFIKDMPDSSLMAKRIAARRMYVCTAPDYFKTRQLKIPQKPQDLISHNCLLYRGENPAHQWTFRKCGKNIAVKVKGNFSANSSQALMHAAIAGKGIVKLPGYMTRQALKDKKLISLLDEYCPKDIGIFAAYSFTPHPSQRIKTFIDFLSSQFKNLA